MELSPRKRAILTEIVRAHIENGEPIGSKILAERLPNAPSTATLRNEMSELCQMGYLEQPHTSAGRIPTSKAYRLYVTELMKQEEMSEERKSVVDGMLSTASVDPENIGISAATILSELTGLPVLVAANPDREIRVKKVSLLPMGRTTAVVFVVSDDGRTKSRLICLDGGITAELAAAFERLANENICGKRVEQLDMGYLQSLVMLAGLDALSVAPLLSVAFELAAQLRQAEVRLIGSVNLFSQFANGREARDMLALLSGNESVADIFSSVTDPVGVIFGDDTAYNELKPAGMIVASYGDGGKLGKIALIGPTRMSYGKLKPCVEYLADRVGNIMSDVLKGLEE